MHHASLVGAAELLVKDHMKGYDPSHDWLHVDRVRKMSLRLFETERAALAFPSPLTRFSSCS
jgi:HD superfamily phosphodiesterase